MDFYSSTEIDPLKKFLFPCEIEALTGSNLNNMRKKRADGFLYLDLGPVNQNVQDDSSCYN